MDDMRYRTAFDPYAQRMESERLARQRASVPPVPQLSPKAEKTIGVVATIIAVPLTVLFFGYFLLLFVIGG